MSSDIVNAVAGTILWLFSVVAISLGLFVGLLGALASRRNADEVTRALAVEVSPPTEAEWAAHQSLLDEAKRDLARRGLRDALRPWLWAFTAPVVALTALPQWATVGDYWQIAATFTIAVLVIFVPWLVFGTARRWLRWRRIRNARVLPGVLQPVLARYSPGGESSFEYELWLGCSFRTPTGAVRTVRFARNAAAANDPRNASWRGPPELPPVYADWPCLGERLPVAVLYGDDRLYEVVGRVPNRASASGAVELLHAVAT